MKNKNVLLGLLALVFAVGSAFGSVKLSAGSGHLLVKYCDETDLICQQFANCTGGTFACYARVNGVDYPLRVPTCPVLFRTHATSSPVILVVDPCMTIY